MDYCNGGKCFYPEGNLWICYENDKISLKRCCIHKPFKELEINEFSQIEDIISYLNDSTQNNFTEYIVNTSRCKTCIVPKNIKRVSVSISHACNLKCYHCFFDKNHFDKPEVRKLYFDTLYKIKGHQLDYILLTDAGEPFFYFENTISYLKSLSLNDTKKIRITTNLSLLNDEKIKLLKEISNSTGVEYEFIASMNGITKETFEKTRIGGNFEECFHNLITLSKTFNNLVVSYVITSLNKDEAQYVKDFFKNYNIKADLYPDFYDENIKNFFGELK